MYRVRLWLVFRLICAAGVFAALSALALGVTLGGNVTPTNQWMMVFGYSTMAGLSIPQDAYVAVFDPQGTQCGEFWVKDAGAYGLMPCYGDDSTTPGDQGAMSGDVLSFTINGVTATMRAVSHDSVPVPPDTVVTYASMDRWQVDLVIPPRPPVTVTLQTAALRLDWRPAGPDVVTYEIWRSAAPYFAPGDPGAVRLGMLASGAGSFTWSDTGGVGSVTVNDAYRIRSLNALSQTVGISQAAADFDFVLCP